MYTMKNKIKAIKPIKAWAVIVEDKFDIGWRLYHREILVPIFSVFKTRRAAREVSKHVIPVLITPIKKKV